MNTLQVIDFQFADGTEYRACLEQSHPPTVVLSLAVLPVSAGVLPQVSAITPPNGGFSAQSAFDHALAGAQANGGWTNTSITRIRTTSGGLVNVAYISSKIGPPVTIQEY